MKLSDALGTFLGSSEKFWMYVSLKLCSFFFVDVFLALLMVKMGFIRIDFIIGVSFCY